MNYLHRLTSIAILIALLSVTTSGQQTVDAAQAKVLFEEARVLAFQPEESKKRLALQKFQELALLSHQAGLTRHELAAKFGVAMVAEDLKEHRLARDFYQQILPLFDEPAQKPHLPSILFKIGTYSVLIGDRNTAIEYYTRLAPMYGQLGQVANQAMVESDIGALNYQLGKYEPALLYLESALERRRKIGNPCDIAATLTNIAAVNLAQRQWTRALDVLQKQALPLYNAGPECELAQKDPANTECPNNLAATLINIGKIYYDLADYKTARCFYDRAKQFVTYDAYKAALIVNLGTIDFALEDYPAALARFEEARRLYAGIAAEALMNIGVARAKQGDALAFANLTEALRLRREIGNANGEAVSHSSLAEVYIRMGKPKDALESLNHAIPLFRASEDQSGEATALINAMIASRMLGDRKTAISNGKLAIERFQQLRIEARGVSGEIERSYLSTVRAAYQNLAELLIEEGLLEQAIEVLSLFQDAQSFARNREHKVDVSKLIRAQQALTTIPGFRAVTLYTLVADRKLYILPVTRNGIDVFTSEIATSMLNQKVENFLDVVRCAERDPYAAASELYDLVFKSTSLTDKRITLENFLEKENAGALLWSLDPPLHSVPLAALYNAATKKFLFEKYQLAVFTRHDAELISREPKAWLTGIGLATSTQFTGREPIPGAEASVTAIFGNGAPGRSGIMKGKTIFNERFTAEELEGLDSRWPLVHIVSHFVFEPGDAQNSFLALGDGNKYTIARMREHPTLFAGVELLAVPICESAAQHPDRYGKEIGAFADLAQHVGAKSVIASLWRVSYHVTPRLMQRFYELAREHPDWPKAELLRQAQLSLVRGEIAITQHRDIARGSCGPERTSRPQFRLRRTARFAHPYYWAAFVLYGSAR